MTEREDYLVLPWSVDDTIENLKIVKENLQRMVRRENLHGKGRTDEKEVAFDFDRAIEALEEIMRQKRQRERGMSLGIGCMERLIERLSNGQAAVLGCGENCKYDYKYCKTYNENCPTLMEIYERLAAYEDIGLLPEQIDTEYVRDCNIIKAELEQYRAIGTVEECRAAVEKMKPKKPSHVKDSGIRYTDSYRCPTCGGAFSGTGIADYCYHCGQALDWNESEGD